MGSRSISLAAFCLVACTENTPQVEKAPTVDIADAAKAEDLTENTLFDFERRPKDITGVVTADSNLFAVLGSSAQHFPGNVALGPFRIGMTAHQVEQVAQARSYSLSAGQESEGSDAECSGEDGGSSRPRILSVIPRRLELTAGSGESYSLRFTDDAGQARLTEVAWAPSTKAFTSASWSAFLYKTYGKPTFSDVTADYATLQWCSTGETRCDGDRTAELPVLTASDDRARGSIFITLSAGANTEDAGPKLAMRPDKSVNPNCPRTLTRGEERLYANYLASLNDPFAPDAPAVFRRTQLPTGLQETLLLRLGSPEWFKVIGKEYIARFEVGYSGDDASFSKIKYVAFSSPDGKAYEATWQGDAKALRSRYALTKIITTGVQP